MWYHQESNRGHKDFQSFALPTELWYLFCLSGCKYTDIFLIRKVQYNILQKKSCEDELMCRYTVY